jgi:hypothetical protein
VVKKALYLYQQTSTITKTETDMTNATMTKTEKKVLIINDSNKARQTFVNENNYQMFEAFTWVATRTIAEIDGCTSFTEMQIAGKYALLAMLDLGLI